jgi:integrase
MPTGGARLRTSLAKAADLWLEAPHPGWGRLERSNQETRLDTHILAVLGKRNCGTIETADLERLLTTMQQKSYSVGYIQQVGRTMRQLFDWLRARGFVKADLLAAVDISGIANPKATDEDEEAEFERGAAQIATDMIPEKDEWSALAEELLLTPLSWMSLGARLSGTVGLRYGELVALTPEVVDLTANTIDVRRSLEAPSKGPSRWKGTKNKARRTVPVPPTLVPELTERVAQVQSAREAGGSPEGLLFCAQKGGRLCRPTFSNSYNAAKGRAAEKGLWQPHYQWRFLRHSAASWMLAQPPDGCGMQIELVSAVLGHATVDFTYRRYVSRTKSYVTQAAAAMALAGP